MYYVISTANPTLTNSQVIAGEINPRECYGQFAVTANQVNTYNLTALNNGTKYYYYFVVVDSSSNTSLVSSGSFTTIDTIAPILTGVFSNNLTGTAADISATSNEDGTLYYAISTVNSSPTNAQVIGGTVTSTFSKGNASVSANVSKKFTITGLTSTTTYFYYIGAVDGSGNKSIVASGKFNKSLVAPTDYIARYRFENNATDSKGTYNLVTATGTPTYSTVSPKEGSHCLSLNEASSLKYANFTCGTNMTLSAWLYLDSKVSNTYPTAIDLGGFGIFYATDSKLFYGSTPNKSNTQSQTTGLIGKWTHVVLSYDGATAVLYINGASECTLSITDTISGTKDLLIGNFLPDSFWKGYIDDVQIYNRVLTADEVAGIYNSY